MVRARYGVSLVLVVAALAVVAGVLAGVVVHRWPQVDPAAPSLSADTIREEVRRHPRLAALLRRRTDPAALTGLLLTVAVTVIVVAIAAVGLLLVMIDSGAGIARSDLPLAEWAAEQSTETSTDVLRLISRPGGTSAVVVLAAVVAVIELRRAGSWAGPALLTITVGGQFALTNLIKWIVDRARPDLEPLTGFAGASFPSGHSAAAAATFACIALLLGRGRSPGVRAVLAALAVAIATAVAATRVLLGVHWFTDVIAGLLVGWAWLAIWSIAFGGRLLRFGAPVGAAERIAEATPAPSE